MRRSDSRTRRHTLRPNAIGRIALGVQFRRLPQPVLGYRFLFTGAGGLSANVCVDAGISSVSGSERSTAGGNRVH